MAHTTGLVIPCAADIAGNPSIAAIGAALPGPVRLTVLAAGLPVRGSIEAIDPDLMAVGAATKLGGVVRLLHAVRDRMGPGSRFAAIAGTLGVEPGPSEAGPGAINAGLINLMKQISLLFGPRVVTVHTLVPGPMDTPRLRSIATTIAQERGVAFDEVSPGRLARWSTDPWPSAVVR